MSKIEIAVSPFYSGNGWTDRGTGIQFEPQVSGQLKTKSFNLSDKEDLTGIKNSVRLNHLILLNGDLNDVADKPNKVNPEELTGEELDNLLNEGGSNEALVSENKVLTKENKELEKQVKELQEEVKQLSQKQDDFKRNKDGSINKKALNDDNTKKDLIAIAEENNIEFDSNANKGDLVDLIVEKLQ